MHKYMTLRGAPQLIRRIIEDLQKVYFNFSNKDTGKKIGAIQLMPREIKTYEVVFPATAKKEITGVIKRVIKEICPPGGGVAVHWGPFKKDKYVDGVEQL